MTSGPRVRSTTPKAMMATEPPRLKLQLRRKPTAPTTGYVDGAWWPRSRDLTAELPALLAVLAARLGPIARIAYRLAPWDPSARRVNPDGTVARLGGYRAFNADTVDVMTSSGHRLTLLVVPPEHGARAAHRDPRAVAQRNDTGRIDDLLAGHAALEAVVPAVHNGLVLTGQPLRHLGIALRV